MNLEKDLADNVLKAINIDDQRSAERFYNHYLFYARNILKDFDKDLQNKIMYEYAEYITKDMK